MRTDELVEDYRCVSCRFYERRGDMDVGWCKRYAPRPTFVREDREMHVAWPAVDMDNWCGEWVSAQDGPA